MSFTKDTLGTMESVGGVNLFESLLSNQNASGSYSGLMSAGDKAKLDGIEEGANNYVHPDSGVVPGTYMQVEVNEKGHVVAGRTLTEGSLKDYGIVDAYIDLVDNSIVLGSHRLKPLTPSDKVRWDQIVNNPDTLAAYGIKDANISEDGIIRLGEMTIKPLTAESQLNTAKLEGIISKDNLPDTLKDLGLIDVAITDGTINIGGDLIKPLTAESKLAANKVEGVLDLKNIPVGAMERCVVVNDDTARFALTADDVQKGDTVKVINPTPTMYMVVDESKLNSEDGYVVYSAGNANSVPWSGITDKPDHYYELPPADINTLGGVIVGDNLTVDAAGKISTHAPYVLPKSDTNTLGGVKVGATLDVADDGTLNVPHATAERAGVVKAGDNINIGADGTINGIPYELPVASATTLGGVKIGDGLTISNGVLSSGVAGGNATHGEKLFTANDTFVVPEGVSILVVTAVGGGGGGGAGGGDSPSAQGKPGGAGGRGSVTSSIPVPVIPGESIPVIVGQGGIGGGYPHIAGSGGSGDPSGGNGTANDRGSNYWGGRGGAGGSKYNSLGGTGGATGTTTNSSNTHAGGGGGGGGASSFKAFVYASGGGGGAGACTAHAQATGGSGGNAVPILYDYKVATSYGAGGGAGPKASRGGNGSTGCVYVRW